MTKKEKAKVWMLDNLVAFTTAIMEKEAIFDIEKNRYDKDIEDDLVAILFEMDEVEKVVKTDKGIRVQFWRVHN